MEVELTEPSLYLGQTTSLERCRGPYCSLTPSKRELA